MGGNAAGGQHEELLAPPLLQCILKAGAADQQIGEADATLNAKKLGHARLAEIGIDENHASTGVRHHDGQIRGRGGLAFARPGGGDHNALGVILNIEVTQIRSQSPVGFNEGIARIFQCNQRALLNIRILGDIADDRQIGDLGDVILGANTGVE